MFISVGVGSSKKTFRPKKITKYDELKEIILGSSYSFGIYKNDHRHLDNFIEAYCIAFDVDEGLSLDKAKEMFSKYKHVIATTRNHQKDKYTDKGKLKPACDRFRIILFLSEKVSDIDSLYATWFSVANQYHSFDPACKDPSRLWYPSKKVVSYNMKGELVVPTTQVAKEVKEQAKPATTSETQKGDLSKKTLKFLLNSAPVGYRHGELYKAARDAHQAGYSKEWFLSKLEELSKRVNDEELVDDGALTTVEDAFDKAPKHEPRPEEVKAFNMVRIGELYKDKTEVDWLVVDLLSKGGVSLVSADPKAGKSTLVRQLIRDVLRGDKFLNRKCKQGDVFYFAIEEQIQIVNASFKRLGVTEKDDLFIHMGDPLTDNTMDDFADLLLDKRPALAVIDTLFDFLEVESESNYREVKRELRRLRRIARETGTHILCVHHNSKAQFGDRHRGNRGILGSQAIAGGVDSIMVIEVCDGDRFIKSSGREIENWDHEIVWDKKTTTYSLGKRRDKEEF